MLIYLLKTTFCLLLFLGFYHLVLEKEKMHRFNRFYLLGSIVFAFLIPSFTITVSPTEFIEPIVQEYQMVDQMQITSIASAEKTEINYMNYVYGLYLLISGILLFYFVKSLHKILLKTRKNEKVNYYTATVILLKEKILPHTFLKYIFINKNEYINDKSEQLILTHELAHVKQKHSLDVLFIELLQIVFWFIPLFRFYKKAIQLNHEFLADDAVIKTHKNISEYQHLLLNVSTQENNIYLASNLNYSLTKKRLLMMTTPSSKTKILLKKLLVLPLTVGFIFAFAQRVEAQEKNNNPQTTEVITEDNGISDEEMNEYNTLIGKAKTSRIFKYKDLTRMKELYKKMSKKQQNSVEDVFKIAPPLPRITLKKKTPTTTQFNSWKNNQKFALWIDKKAVKNSELNNYKNTDFSYFSGSKVYKNARTKRFPQEYQFRLYTNAAFKKMKEKEAAKNKNTIRIFINKEGGLLVNGKATTIDKLKDALKEIDIDKTNAFVSINGDEIVKKGMVTDIKEILRENGLYKVSFSLKLFPPTPPINIVSEYKKLFNKGAKTKIYKEKDINKMVTLYERMSKEEQASVIDIKKVIPPPPPKMDLVFTYKRLAERIQKTDKNRKANIVYLKELYGKMTASQKKQVTEPAKVLPPPPPQKRDIVKEYNVLFKNLEKPSNNSKEKIKQLNYEIRVKYTSMTATQKNQVKHPSLLKPPPPKPQIKETEEQELKEAEKLRVAQEKINKSLRMRNNDPRAVVTGGKMKMSLLETVKDWRKKGARFLYNKKAVTAENAIKIVSENKNIRVYSVGAKIDEPTLVYISDKK